MIGRFSPSSARPAAWQLAFPRFRQKQCRGPVTAHKDAASLLGISHLSPDARMYTYLRKMLVPQYEVLNIINLTVCVCTE